MTQRVIVIGGSDQGRQAIDIIEQLDGMEIVGVLDRQPLEGELIAGHPVLGSDEDLSASAESSRATAFVVAIGDNFSRQRVLTREMAACPQLEPVRVVHPSAVVARTAEIGRGTIIMAGVVVSNACRIGAGALLGTRSSLDHDTVLGDYASLAPAATTGGGVRIGECTAIGLGANVIHGIAIGNNSVVGAGALVLEDVPDGVVAYGAPARVARSRDVDEPYLTGA
jgi:sugar O-acyltransferase (sialic acid O-acetyltransferase NeuD family)